MTARVLRYGRIALSVVAAVSMTGCASQGESGNPSGPSEQRLPPGTCGGVASVPLLTELFVAADIGIAGGLAELESGIDLDEPSLGCAHLGFAIGTGSEETDSESNARTASRGRARIVPLGTLNGFVGPSTALLVSGCSAGRHAGLLTSYVGFDQYPDVPNERVRMLTARLVVDIANRANDALGCGDPPLRVPAELAPIPQPEPLAAADEVCGLVPHADIPELAAPGGVEWTHTRTPGSGNVLETCLLSRGDEAFGGFIVSRGVLADAVRGEPQYADPPFDHVCNGEPVSYRMQMGSGADQQRGRELLGLFAAAAAERAGCPLP